MKGIPLILSAAVVSASWFSLEGFDNRHGQAVPPAPPSPVYGDLASTSPFSASEQFPALDGAVAWINSPPLSPSGLRGKVILVDFWTYSCINWRREFPYVRAWADKYRNKGLVVIGVHSPEFEFEKGYDNINRAAQAIGVDYPIAIDSNFAIWRRFDNRHWPALYFIDAAGRIRHRHFGEGDYERSERVLQQLLREAGSADVGDELVSVVAKGAEAAADWHSLKSPESYVGYARAENFISPGGLVPERSHVYTAPAVLQLNEWALQGEWLLRRADAQLTTPNGRIVQRFHARDLHIVMGPGSRQAPIRFRVLIDGNPPGSAHGADVDQQGHGIANEHRMYQIVRQPGLVKDRMFEIEFLDPGAEVYAITFG